MNYFQYTKYRKNELKVVFHCKMCTEKAGQIYSVDVHILKPAPSNVSIELNVVEMSTEETAEERKPPLTTP